MPSASSAAAFTPHLSDIVLIDNGASTIRILSPASSASPSSSSSFSPPSPLSFPNLIARSRSARTTYVSSSLSACQDLGGLHLRLPFERGYITDWPALKLVWDHCFTQLLSHSRPNADRNKPKDKAKAKPRLLEGKTVVITEPYFNLLELEEAMDTVLFEEYGVQAIWRCTAAQLAAWADVWTSKKAARKRLGPVTNREGSPVADSASSSSSPPPPLPRSTAPVAPETPPTTAPLPAATTAAKRTRSRYSAAASVAEPGSSSSGGGGGSGSGSGTKPIPKRSKILRPECILVLDLGFSYTHAVPLIRGSIHWPSVRRLNLGGKLLTNLLKETLSFRQWDMMDETYLTNIIKERCCFVAAEAGPSAKRLLAIGRPERVVDEMRRRRPSQWSFAELVELCKATRRRERNPIRQEWKLPDYETIPTDERALFGYVTSGPGSKDAERRAKEAKRARLASSTREAEGVAAANDSSSRLAAALEEDEEERQNRDVFIADLAPASDGKIPPVNQRRSDDSSATDSDSDEDDSTDEDGGDARPRKKQKRRAQGDGQDQILVMESERFQTMEALFNPGLVGLDQEPLHELVASSIAALPPQYRDAMWPNILLIGGGANVPGLKQRLLTDLQPLAPDDVPVNVRISDEPSHTPIHGAYTLATAGPGTPEHRFFRAHLLTRAEWAGSSPGSGKGPDLARTRFESWSAVAATSERTQEEV